MEILDNNFIHTFELLDITKKDINFFDIIPPKEIIVSKWLEFIFDPTKNGVGNLPLAKLLDLVDKDINIDDYEFNSIETESATDNQKRIDILIKYSGLWIVIENKIDSYENNNQTDDYYNYIESVKEDNKVVYVYLKPNYNKSIPVNSSFKTVTYNELINNLKEISKFDYYDKDVYKYFREFIISGGRFMSDVELEITDSLRFYIENIDKFDQITNEYKSKNKLMLNKMSEEIIASLNEDGSDYDYSKNTNAYIQFYKSNWKNERHDGVHYEVVFIGQNNSANLLGKKVLADIVLHIEKNITDSELKRFAENGIDKNGQSLQAFYNGEPIKIRVELSFITTEDIKESVNKIIFVLKDYKEKFESVIDKCLN